MDPKSVPHPGTRFLLFPNLPSLEDEGTPELVWVSTPAGSASQGPSDDRMYVIDPVGKESPYGYYQHSGRTVHFKPPWEGPIRPPAQPGPEGHFDHLRFGTPQFEQAHAYGSIRFTLDIWEGYFGHPIEWHFSGHYDRLEILFLRGLDNAFAGFGSVEIGSYEHESGAHVNFGLSFDVLSHEVGHLIIYKEVGIPDTNDVHGEYFGFHESAADLVSLISLMHFQSPMNDLLAESRGNLYTFNHLNRFGEVSNQEQLRLASNNRTLFEFKDGWTSEHDLSQPLTGAMFDILVDVFHENLVEAGLISVHLEDLSDRIENDPDYVAIIQPLFDQAYRKDPDEFAEALAGARDYMGIALAGTWRRLSSLTLNYEDVAQAMLAADREVTGGRFERIISVNMRNRGIGEVSAGPRLTPPDETSHAFSARTLVADGQDHGAAGHGCSHLPFSTRMALARMGNG
ncbi:hypothetical protein [Roseibium aggregatum]|uniref:Peptidase M4 family protein n=1 Tax=Roseibium aggregatum TaxID=187304 RepID=A0A939EGC8_9HYPH|nr:hypothetical protein [Roseibium aggregatum]MBN9671260.1 hypothetical protein [Roseibium aggregatum]